MKISVIAVAGAALAVSAAQAFPGEYDTNTLRAIGQGRALYLQHCASCHGPAAKGDSQKTFGTNGRTVSPLDLTAIAARDGRFDAVHVRSHIEGRSWGKCAAGMPCWQQVLRASQQQYGATGQGEAYSFLQMWKLAKYVQRSSATSRSRVRGGRTSLSSPRQTDAASTSTTRSRSR